MSNIKSRADTVAKKNKIIDSLFQAWLNSPDLRLGQLIVNAIRLSKDANIPLFYIEDSALETAITEFIDKNLKIK